jgi:hypothetical protein
MDSVLILLLRLKNATAATDPPDTRMTASVAPNRASTDRHAVARLRRPWRAITAGRPGLADRSRF